MEYRKIKQLVIFSIIIGCVISISFIGYSNIYLTVGDLAAGTAYFLMFITFVITIETIGLFIIWPILYLRLRNNL